MTPSEGRAGRRLTATVTDLEIARQRAFLVGSLFDTAASLDELARLTDTAGSDPVGQTSPRHRKPDPATFIGSGQASRLAEQARRLDVDVVIFDDDLTPTQQRNLQAIFGCDVVDRSGLILDIFAQHATSRAGMLQVELALLRYHLPRLRGRGTALSRQAGGIGTRGPGETKLETDRRRIEQRITRLEHDLAKLHSTRMTQRKARRRNNVPLVALVGYTNAGKSTLLNRLTGTDVLVEDRLFSTLDATVRRFQIPDGRQVVFSDTVGFVRRIPHGLIEAFRSTLDEVADATLMIHVVDASDQDAESHIATVRDVLADLGAAAIPELLALNKQDSADPIRLHRLLALHPEALAFSAATGEGIDEMLGRIADMLAPATVVATLTIPYTRGEVLAALHREGEVMDERHGETAVTVTVRLAPDRVERFEAAIA